MKQVFSYTAIILLAGSFFTACRKSSDGGVPKQTNVYVFGSDGVSPSNGGYWKNGVFTPIYNYGYPASGYVSGNDVYAAGYQDNVKVSYCGYWKNGIFTKLDSSNSFFSSTDTTLRANSIFISGSDVYMLETYEIDNLSSYKYFSKYWKNGVENDYTNNSEEIFVNNIFVSGNDVYICGNLYTVSAYVPKYWKNGVETILANASDDAYANQIFVSGNDVYVAGAKGNYAGYWKNGAFTTLTNGSQPGSAQFIYVSGNDVYVAGRDDYYQCEYWKNGAIVAPLGGSPHVIYLTSMYVSGSDVYIAATEDNNTALYWKNGVPTYLTDGASSYGTTSSIFVTNN